MSNTVAKPRHFSNFETSLLARHVGLAMDTMWTWNFINPNAEAVAKLRMELESRETDLILSWPFAGDTSPWINPVLTVTGKRTDKNDNEKVYTTYQIEWSKGNPQWSGRFARPGPAKQELPSRRDTVIAEDGMALARPSLRNVTLLGTKGTALPQQPPWLGFDAGTFDDETRDLNIRFKNSLDRPLNLRDVKVQDLPRVMSINAMMPNGRMIDIFEREFEPWEVEPRRPLEKLTGTDKEIPQDGRLLLGRGEPQTGPPHFDSTNRRGMQALKPGKRGLRCHAGITADDLFPATTMYITATIADTVGAVSRLFYQVAGRRTRVP